MPHPATACLLALTVYTALAFAFQGFIFHTRTGLPEPDDAYTYILKSQQIADGCALQDCPAVASLRAQLAVPAGEEAAEWRRYRMESRVLLVYHPLYSAVLLALNAGGLGWESAFIALSYLGVILIAAGIAFFLVTLWGPAPAALALMLLAFSNFNGQGLTSIVPSNMALGIAFFAWSFALRGWRWSMAAAVLAMLLMHPVGKVYAVAALLMSAAMERDLRSAMRGLAPYLVTVGLVGVAALLPLLISQPVLRVPPEPMPEGFTVVDGLLANLHKAQSVISRGYGRAPALGIPMALIVYWLAWKGYRTMPDAHRRRFATAFVVLAGMCVLLLAHVLPHYPGEGFIRGWVALAVTIAGAAAFRLLGPDGVLAKAKLAGMEAWRDPATLSRVFVGIFALSGALVLSQHALKIRDRHYQTFLPDQVRQLALNCGTALHGDETSALFYLSHGANACPAVYLPAMTGEATAQLAGLKAPLLLVAAKPGPQEIAIARGRPAELTIADAGVRRVHLRLAASDADASVTIRVSARDHADTVFPAQTGGIIAVDLPPGEAVRTVTLTVTGRFDEIYLEGVGLDAEAAGWPWNRNVTLSYRNRAYAFSAPELTGGRFTSMEVIDARGSTLLAKLNAPQ